MENLPFGELLKALRRRQKLKQQELARRMGKHLNTIGTWERGECLPNGKGIVLELARVLRLDDQETRQLLDASLTSPAPYWYVPYQRNLFFTGREDILAALHAHLSTHPATAPARLSTLHGLGGIGKTQLAVEYAYRHALEYQAIFWIEAENTETIISSFQQIAQQLNLAERQETNSQHLVEAVQRWLTFHNHWLLIWDNGEDLELLQRFLPPTRQGSVLITTRRQALGMGTQTLEVPPMSLHEGRLLLLLRAGMLPARVAEEDLQRFAVDAPEEHAAAEELTRMMGGLPLALDQIGAYVNETRCSLSGYLQRYKKQKIQLLERRGVSRWHPHSVATTFKGALQEIKRTYPAAVDLLHICAFLSPEAIPEEIFAEGTMYRDSRLASIAQDVLLLDEVLAALGTCSLLQRQPEEKMLTIHRLVQAVLRETLEETERRRWAEQAMLLVNSAFPHAEGGPWSQCERLLPQALTILRVIEQYQITREEAGRLHFKTAFYLKNRTRYLEAKPA